MLIFYIFLCAGHRLIPVYQPLLIDWPVFYQDKLSYYYYYYYILAHWRILLVTVLCIRWRLGRQRENIKENLSLSIFTLKPLVPIYFKVYSLIRFYHVNDVEKHAMLAVSDEGRQLPLSNVVITLINFCHKWAEVLFLYWLPQLHKPCRLVVASRKGAGIGNIIVQV